MNLEEIKARAEAATPGPWGWYDPPGAGYGPQLESEEQHARWGGMACLLVTAEVCSACHERGAPCLSGKQEDKDFIAHAREDIPALIAEVERLNKENLSFHAQATEYYEETEELKKKLAVIRTAARHVVEAYEGGGWTRDDYGHLIEISGGEAVGSEDIRALAEAIKEENG